MAISNGYCTLAEFYGRFDAISADSGERDAKIEDHIEAASRWIDKYCMRTFYATTETRTYTARDSLSVNVRDLLTVVALKTDEDGDRTYETTWNTTDYDLMPSNDSPYQWLEVTPNGLYTFPCIRLGVEIEGTWGYIAATPEDIKEACLLQSARLYAREVTVLGVGGTTALGKTIVKTPKDEDIVSLLEYYIKKEVR